MAALLFQIEHHRRQALWRHGLPGHALADVVVLTVLAVQIAARKENRAGAVASTQDVLFAVMRAVAGDVGRRADATGAGALRAVNPAVVAAEMTLVQCGLGLCDALGESAAIEKRKINRESVRGGMHDVAYSELVLSVPIILLVLWGASRFYHRSSGALCTSI